MIPTKLKIGAKVRNIYTGQINTVVSIYFQAYLGAKSWDYTVEFAEGGWNKGQNLQLISPLFLK